MDLHLTELVGATPTVWTYGASKSWTVVSDTTGYTQSGLLGPDYTLVIDKLKTSWRYIKILAVTFSFDWYKFQGPASTVTQDENAEFWWCDNLPYCDPATTAFEALSTMANAENRGLHGVTKRHGNKWHVTVRPKCMRRGTLFGGQASDLQTRWFWASCPWMDMTIPDAVANDLRELSLYVGQYALSGLQAGDVVRRSLQVKFMVKEPLVA